MSPPSRYLNSVLVGFHPYVLPIVFLIADVRWASNFAHADSTHNCFSRDATRRVQSSHMLAVHIKSLKPQGRLNEYYVNATYNVDHGHGFRKS